MIHLHSAGKDTKCYRCFKAFPRLPSTYSVRGNLGTLLIKCQIYLSILEKSCTFALTMADTIHTKILLAETKKRRKEIKEMAKALLVGQVLSHPYFPHDIYINVSGIKEWLNQPHKHYAEKNEALLQLQELLLKSEYLGTKTDPKGRDFIKTGHIFKTTIAQEASWIIVSETIWGECMVHSVSDNYPYLNEEQDF